MKEKIHKQRLFVFFFLAALMMLGFSQTANACGGSWPGNNYWYYWDGSQWVFWKYTSSPIYCSATQVPTYSNWQVTWDATITKWTGNYALGCTESAACQPACVANQGQFCASSPNACDQKNTGTIQCNGACSATTPANPGFYGFSCTACNNVGTCNSGTIQCSGTCSAVAPPNVVIDTTPPTGSISASPSTVNIGQTITVSMTGADNVGVDKIGWSNNGVYLWHYCGGVLSCTSSGEKWTTTQSSAGTYVPFGVIFDTVGNSLYIAGNFVTVVAPNNPPNTPSQPSGPASGFTGTSYSYSTSTTDPNGDSVLYKWFWGDGTYTTTGFISSGATVSASHSWSSPGTYTVMASATDSKGASSGWSSWLLVTISAPDTTPPTGSISASPSTVNVGQTITISMSGSDNVGVNSLFWNDAYSGGSRWYPCGGTPSCSGSWSFVPFTPGNYIFVGTIQDSASNIKGVTSNTVTVPIPTPLHPQTLPQLPFPLPLPLAPQPQPLRQSPPLPLP